MTGTVPVPVWDSGCGANAIRHHTCTALYALQSEGYGTGMKPGGSRRQREGVRYRTVLVIEGGIQGHQRSLQTHIHTSAVLVCKSKNGQCTDPR